MKNSRLAVGLIGAVAMFLHACGGSGGGGSGGGADADALDVETVSNGFGNLLPHTVFKLGTDGNPTPTIIPIQTQDDFLQNVTTTNLIRPTTQFPEAAILPNGAIGNHFIYARFNHAVDIDSVLSSSPGAQSNSGLTGRITLVSLDPVTGTPVPVKARVFVNGFTYAGTPVGAPGEPLKLPKQKWVETGDDGYPTPNTLPDGTTPGVGFPGSTPATHFFGAQDLISPRTVIFVADNDGDLATFDAFPQGRQIKLRITTDTTGENGKSLKRAALASTTVGPDVIRPEIAKTPPPNNLPSVSPGQGDSNVDPLTNVRVEFTEPVQPFTVGAIPNGAPPTASTAILLQFGPPSNTVTVPFTLLPVSVLDLTTFELTPSYNFPGSGPSTAQCGVFNEVRVTINPNQFQDLSANVNQFGGFTSFTTGSGPGVVNAPVTPDTIYIGRTGAIPGLSIVDLNGFGGGTGDPTFDPTYLTVGEGRSNYPNNPNLKSQGTQMQPVLVPGQCTINGGSAGVFTLTRDSALDNLLLRAPLISSVGDMMLGHALDSSFNNASFPFGCQANGGSLCTSDGFKIVNPAANGGFVGTSSGNTLQPIQNGGTAVNGIIGYGAENLACWSPHPNPPPLAFPPLCVSPFLNGQEPTSINVSALVGFGGLGLQNLLVPGDPFGQPALNVPPTGLLTPEQNGFFQGPSPGGATTTASCVGYMMRQQIGHYLYLIDRGRREIVVLNSNRMTVVDRIPTVDPTSLAMSPNLNLLAIVNQLGDLVSFLDIDPSSSTFHKIVQETVVGHRPRGIAWDPGNEDILVTNEGENTMSVISAASLGVRKVVSSQLNMPFDVAITPRQLCWGFNRDVYYGYVLNRNGRVAVFESGPNTVNGWGYDDMIGIASATFRNPKAIQPDHVDLRSGVWIAHEGPIDILNDQPGAFGIGAMSKLVIESGLNFPIILNGQSIFNPQFRDLFLGVQISIGTDVLSGLPIDIAFDDMRSLAGLPNTITPFSTGAPIPVNGKQLVRGGCPAIVNNNEPRYMFVAVPNPTNGTGVVDVVRIDGSFVRIDTNPFQAGVQSIPATGVQIVMDYYRQ